MKPMIKKLILSGILVASIAITSVTSILIYQPKLNKLRDENKSLISEVNDLEDRLETIGDVEQLQTLLQRIASLEASSTLLQNQIDSKNAEIVNKLFEIDALQDRIDNFDDDYAEVELQLIQARADLLQLETDYQSLEDEKNNIIGEKIILQNEYASLLQENSNLENQLDDLKSELEIELKNVDELKEIYYMPFDEQLLTSHLEVEVYDSSGLSVALNPSEVHKMEVVNFKENLGHTKVNKVTVIYYVLNSNLRGISYKVFNYEEYLFYENEIILYSDEINGYEFTLDYEGQTYTNSNSIYLDPAILLPGTSHQETLQFYIDSLDETFNIDANIVVNHGQIKNGILYSPVFEDGTSNIEYYTIGDGSTTPGNALRGNSDVDLTFEETIDGIEVQKIGQHAFSDSQIESVVIHEFINEIGMEAFIYNEINSLTIPASVKGIGISAFSNNNINYLNLSEGLEWVGPYSFLNNKILSLTIPSTLELIGISAFANNSLTTLTIPETTNYLNIQMTAFLNNKIHTLNFLNESINMIDKAVFAMNKLTTLTLPDNIEYISEEAFALNELTAVNFGNNIEHIGDRAFAENKLQQLTITENISGTELIIGIHAFSKNKLVNVDLPNNLKHLSDYSFSYNNMVQINLPESIESIGEGVFANNILMTKVIINSDMQVDIGLYNNYIFDENDEYDGFTDLMFYVDDNYLDFYIYDQNIVPEIRYIIRSQNEL